MRELTEHQKEFILENFFKTELYDGWENIAIKLITKGECIVPSYGNTRFIWGGEFGYFITTMPADGFVDCDLYKFDLEGLLKSKLYKDIKNIDINYYKARILRAKMAIEQIKKL